MNENSLQAVSRVEYADSTRAITQVGQTDAAAAAQAASTAAAVRPAREKNGVEEPKRQPILSNLSDVRLKFQVDPETNDVTVLVLDKASKKVIRTIPAEDIKKLNEGDLFGLTA